MSNPEINENIKDTAAEWFARLQSGNVSDECKAEFFGWLDASEQHQLAYIEVEQLWDGLAVVEAIAEREQQAVADNLVVVPASWWRKPAIPAALAASLALFVVGFLGFGGAFFDDVYQTGVGERAQFVLDDGSRVSLNTDSRIRVSINGDKRVVELQSGEVFFNVAKDASRPFVVDTAGGVVRVLGTQFNVMRSNGHSTVTVLEGLVAVENNAELSQVAELSYTPDTTLTVDQQVELSEASTIEPVTADADAIAAWREGKLIYNGTQFKDVLADLSRYFDGEIKSGDAALDDIEVVAILQLEEKQSTLEALEASFNVIAIEQNEQLTLLFPSK